MRFLFEVGEWFDEGGGEGEFAFVDAGGEFAGAFVGHAEHFVFGVEVVDVVQGKCLGGARESW